MKPMEEKEQKKYEAEFERLQAIYKKKFGDVYPTMPAILTNTMKEMCDDVRECIEKNTPWVNEQGVLY